MKVREVFTLSNLLAGSSLNPHILYVCIQDSRFLHCFRSAKETFHLICQNETLAMDLLCSLLLSCSAQLHKSYESPLEIESFPVRTILSPTAKTFAPWMCCGSLAFRAYGLLQTGL